MPAILNIEHCQYTRIHYTFESETLDYTIEDSPDWADLNVTGIDPGPPEEAAYDLTIFETAPLGSYELQLNPGLDYITVVVSDCSIVTELCQYASGTLGPVDPPFDAENWEGIVHSDETGTISFDQETQTLTYNFPEPGTYWATLISAGSPDTQQAFVFEVAACYEEYDPCLSGEATNPLNVAWFNRDGGWENYLFLSRKTYKKQIGNVTEFKSTGLIKKYVSIDDVYNGRDVPSGLIPSSHLDKVEEMKYTIQAYLYNDVTENWDIPILIDAASFNLKQEQNGFYEYNFSFIYSTQLKVQNQ